MKKVTINGKDYRVTDGTILYPSNSAAIRNRLEIHIPEGQMTRDDFFALFADTSKLSEIKIIETDDNKSQSDPDFIKYETTCKSYTEPSFIGIKRIDNVDPTDGSVVSETHFVAELEQPLYIERMAAQLLNK